MRRFALLVEYRGGGFVGWQRQDSGVSVQEVLETAAGHLAGGQKVECVAAGRTDAGVHALGQVVHVDLDTDLPPVRVREALNFHTRPHPVSVRAAVEVAPSWHARFSARGRAYEYRIVNRVPRLVLEEGRAWHVRPALDEGAMQTAAALLLGKHDFSSFRAASCQARSALRTLDRLEVVREGETIRVFAEARSFLHHQVRNMVGSLRLVGEGRWAASRVAEVLAARDRTKAGPTAPAEGLCFVRVDYEDDVFSRDRETP